MAGPEKARTPDGVPAVSAPPRLSTDYLNRYGEALMLIEMVPMDREVVADLDDWRVVGYREHFAASQLRCATSALAAYDALDPARRTAFETVCEEMAELIGSTTRQLRTAPNDENAADIVEPASRSLRDLIGVATRFINDNGKHDIVRPGDTSAQIRIDTLFDS